MNTEYEEAVSIISVLCRTVNFGFGGFWTYGVELETRVCSCKSRGGNSDSGQILTIDENFL